MSPIRPGRQWESPPCRVAARWKSTPSCTWAGARKCLLLLPLPRLQCRRAPPDGLPATRASRTSAAAPVTVPVPAFPEAVAAKLAKLGIRNKRDLALHLPLRYEDETRLT